MKKTIWIIIVLIVIVVLLVIFNGKKEDDGVVKIGLAVAQTGFASNWGEGEVNTVMMVYEEYKDKLPEIKFVIENTESDGLGTVNAIKKLVEIDKVDVIIGPTWGDSFQGGYQISNKAKIPVISPSAAFETLETGFRTKYMYSTWWLQKGEAKVIGQDLKNYNRNKIVFVHDQDSFNTNFGILFVEALNKEWPGYFSIEKIEIPIGTNDFRTTIAKIKSMEVNGLIILTQDTSSIGPFMKQLKEQGMEYLPVYSTTATENEDHLKKFPGMFDGIRYTFPDFIDDENYIKAREMLKKKYGESVAEGPSFVTTYNASKVLFEILSSGARTSEEITDALKDIKIKGVIGVDELQFDQDGQIKDTKFIIKTIENNKFVNTEPFNKEEYPAIENMTPSKIKVGDKIRVQGINLAGFEGDLDFIITNSKGEKAWVTVGNSGILNPNDFEFVLENKYCQQNNSYSGLPCESWLNIVPDKYKLYTSPWGNTSNTVEIEVLP